MVGGKVLQASGLVGGAVGFLIGEPCPPVRIGHTCGIGDVAEVLADGLPGDFEGVAAEKSGSRGEPEAWPSARTIRWRRITDAAARTGTAFAPDGTSAKNTSPRMTTTPTPAPGQRCPHRDLQDARHLLRLADELAVDAAFSEQILRMRLLENTPSRSHPPGYARRSRAPAPGCGSRRTGR